MELYELKYFLAVAEVENLHTASKQLHISPASLSKAVGRLEDDLKVPLFKRVGRNIRLTNAGKHLQIRARDLVDTEESIRSELSGKESSILCALAGREVLMSYFGVKIVSHLKKLYKNCRVSL